MSALRVALLFTDGETGQETQVGRWLVAGPELDPNDPGLLAMVGEMVHEDLISSEELAETYCQHGY